MLQATTLAVNKHNCQCGNHPAVQNKNRYPDILPCWFSEHYFLSIQWLNDLVLAVDSQRVVLQLEERSDDSPENDRAAASDYINATLLNVIKVYFCPKNAYSLTLFH